MKPLVIVLSIASLPYFCFSADQENSKNTAADSQKQQVAPKRDSNAGQTNADSASRGKAGGGRFSRPIVLGPDDRPAFDEPPRAST